MASLFPLLKIILYVHFPSLQHLSVLVKLGEQGSLLFPAVGEPLRQSAVPAPSVVDTTGAGDTFTAAYAVATLEGRSSKDALAFAGTLEALSLPPLDSLACGFQKACVRRRKQTRCVIQTC